MIKKILFFMHHSILFFILLGFAALFLFFQKDVLPFLAQKYLKEFDIKYSSLQGTLFNGVEIRDFQYEKSIKAKKLTIKYNLLSLLQPTPRIDFIGAEGAVIELGLLMASLDTNESAAAISFNISKIKLKDAALHYEKEKIKFDLLASELNYRDFVDIEKIDLKLKTKYADAEFFGYMKENALRGRSSLLLSKAVHENYLGFLEYEPKRMSVDVAIDSQKIDLSTTLKSAGIKGIAELKAEDARLDLSYLINNGNITLYAEYKARYKGHEALISQSLAANQKMEITSQIEAKIADEQSTLPFDSFHVGIEYDKAATHARFSAKELDVDVLTHDFKKFMLHGDTRYAKFDAELSRDNNETFLESDIYPKEEFLRYKEHDLKRFSRLKLNAHEKNQNISLFLKSDIFSLSLFGNETKADGYANLGSAFFDYRLDIKNKKAVIKTKIDSAHTFMKELELKEGEYFFDAKAEAQTDIDFGGSLEIYSTLHLPFYTLKLDSKRSFSDKDNRFEFVYKDNELTLKKYNFGALNRRIYSNRASKVIIDADSNIKLKELWIYDTLLLRGLVKTSDMSADFSLKSDSFHYVSKDADVTLKIDLQAAIESDGKQHINGAVEIQEGVVMYKPRKEYSISDEDIIIIQDMKESEQRSDREMNVLVTSSKPIAYKVEDISVTAVPNLLIHQEAGSCLEIFGVLNIKNGEVTLNDKVFAFDESEIYFYGGKEINPHLNLNLHYYTLDHIDIEIYITNKMSSPLVIFSSKPAMSQNDILSYILFDGSVSSVFDTASEGTSKTSLNTLLLGTGLKNMVNESTNVKLDTLNILTNKEGTLGYEIGARLNKKIRIVYKNDEISSLILQYSINRSLRLDVDVKETGQGVSIIYIKDFDLRSH